MFSAFLRKKIVIHCKCSTSHFKYHRFLMLSNRCALFGSAIAMGIALLTFLKQFFSKSVNFTFHHLRFNSEFLKWEIHTQKNIVLIVQNKNVH